MSQALGVLDLTFVAGEDLSNAQYQFVYVSDNQTVKLCTTGSLDAIGVLQNNPKAGEEALVRVLGTSKVKADEYSIAAGSRIVSSENAKAVTKSGTGIGITLGIALESANNGNIFEAFLIHDTF